MKRNAKKMPVVLTGGGAVFIALILICIAIFTTAVCNAEEDWTKYPKDPDGTVILPANAQIVLGICFVIPKPGVVAQVATQLPPKWRLSSTPPATPPAAPPAAPPASIPDPSGTTMGINNVMGTPPPPATPPATPPAVMGLGIPGAPGSWGTGTSSVPPLVKNDGVIEDVKQSVKEAFKSSAIKLGYNMPPDSEQIMREVTLKMIETELDNCENGYSDSSYPAASGPFKGHDVGTDDEIMKMIETYFSARVAGYMKTDAVARRKALNFSSEHPLFGALASNIPPQFSASPDNPVYPAGHAYEGYKPYNYIGPVWHARETVKRNTAGFKAEIERENGKYKYPPAQPSVQEIDPGMLAGAPAAASASAFGLKTFNEAIKYIRKHSKSAEDKKDGTPMDTSKTDIAREPDFGTGFEQSAPEKILRELNTMGYKCGNDMIDAYKKAGEMLSGTK